MTTEAAGGRRNNGLAGIIFVLAVLLLVAGALFVADGYGRRRAYDILEARATNAAELNAVLLRTVLEKQRSLPFVLSQDRDVITALRSRDPALLQGLNEKFEGLLPGTRASVIYLLDAAGLSLSASNWNQPDSFVGVSYSFRPYYTRAMETGSAEHYALGTISKRPGLYISRRMEGPDGVLGVVVVKVEFDELEADWRRNSDPSFVVDGRGIVLITSSPEWRFMAAAPIAREQIGPIRESLQFGDASLEPLAIRPLALRDQQPDLVRARLPDMEKDGSFLRVTAAVPTTNWTLQLLTPAAATIAESVRTAQLLALLFLAPLVGITGFFLRRRNLALRRAQEQEQSRLELERRVAERTADLSKAHSELLSEAEERQKAETKLQTVQLELVQANRLAILGQVTAGVAHEINQPVAAIRSYADNAATLLARNKFDPLKDNLAAIAGLTERIGSITDELRTFSRKGTGDAGPVAVAEIIEGALLLLGSRFRQRAGQILTKVPAPDLKVHGNRIRLEQVLINLLQNALEATEGGPSSQISVRYADAGEQVELIVSDNGPGIPAHIMEALFTPFNTSKDRGLGLGLVICHDIVAEYGGRIEVETGSNGTKFTIYLRKAG
ncbi:ATP-binding protein [Phyllobacterium sp. 21LDTY02-6]|uniref:ATP-binding protein n=1 Tax=unclassified Phyllobacterium TaxID=2638441 RepID=UPI0020220BA9|nr:MULTISPECIES: ATP-binding protein [unclassified Phyllobacterium]MCO4319380.1 ATP-binding protein [Phyllobacterium sp. 21LDTY02-6]MCX8279858.1 ATP-binding protein [Phyllobacterium sp. 0TCS1.6C]MCX8295538.1 ATP-binding protein [Phyllobacterium sp. 0TCS1.6A]